MIGQEWYYISAIGNPTTYEIKSAKVIGETPRKWILREVEEIERLEEREAKGHDRWAPSPGGSPRDWSISKKGDARREGKGGIRKGCTRVFTTHKHVAEAMIRERHEANWAIKNVYRIAQHIQHQIAHKDPALLRKVAELIGYKEEGT